MLIIACGGFVVFMLGFVFAFTAFFRTESVWLNISEQHIQKGRKLKQNAKRTWKVRYRIMGSSVLIATSIFAHFSWIAATGELSEIPSERIIILFVVLIIASIVSMLFSQIHEVISEETI